MSQPAISTAADARPWSATLLSSARITSKKSPEDVRRLRFAVLEAGFQGEVGQSLSVRAPGRFGQRWHERLYSIADIEHSDDRDFAFFELLVRRCHYVDAFNGERYDGVASNHLCDLPLGCKIEFTGPVGYPFPIPEDRGAGLLMVGMGTGIAPFRGLVRRIYDELGGWKGPVRLFYGARSGLEMLYQNDENADLGLYYDKPTFQAFAAVSPRPHFDEPPALDKALIAHAAEVWSMLKDGGAHLFISGPGALLPQVETAMAQVAGSDGDWTALRRKLQAEDRWHELLY
jgi:ferredoxin--NADP+ reductase